MSSDSSNHSKGCRSVNSVKQRSRMRKKVMPHEGTDTWDESTNTSTSTSDVCVANRNKGQRNLGKLLKFYESVSSINPSTINSEQYMESSKQAKIDESTRKVSHSHQRLRTQSLDSLEEEFSIDYKHYASCTSGKGNDNTNTQLLEFDGHEEVGDEHDPSSCEIAEIKIDLDYNLVIIQCILCIQCIPFKKTLLKYK